MPASVKADGVDWAAACFCLKGGYDGINGLLPLICIFTLQQPWQLSIEKSLELRCSTWAASGSNTAHTQ